MTKRLKRTSAAWIKAAKELGIRVEAPYVIKDKQGHSLEFIAYVPDFGGSKGAVLIAATPPGLRYDHKAVACAKQHRFYYSILNSEAYSEFDRDDFIATLDDWGYFGPPERKPVWYTGKYWGQATGEQKSPKDWDKPCR
jgi:hypothetical protein